MIDGHLRFFLNRISERLWVKPLAACVLSIIAAFLARLADALPVTHLLPEIDKSSLKSLLAIISDSMLVIATLAVASMVAAYNAASTSVTPRTFALVIADDVSQNALSTFIGAFIFSIVASVAMENGYYGQTGRFALFLVTILVFAVVIITFLRWVDRIARLGRTGATIDKVEAAADAALQRRRREPALGGVAVRSATGCGEPIYALAIGYLQCVEMAALQSLAEQARIRITLAVVPGAFLAPGRPLAYVTADTGTSLTVDRDRLLSAFIIGDNRTFDDDPRFGLIVLSEIASRALSPAVNDPGTAIDVIGTVLRLLARWCQPVALEAQAPPRYDRIEVPLVSTQDLFADAFAAIGRDGAAIAEVMIRLQKALAVLADMGDEAQRDAARQQSRRALAHAEQALVVAHERDMVRELAAFSAH